MPAFTVDKKGPSLWSKWLVIYTFWTCWKKEIRALKTLPEDQLELLLKKLLLEGNQILDQELQRLGYGDIIVVKRLKCYKADAYLTSLVCIAMAIMLTMMWRRAKRIDFIPEGANTRTYYTNWWRSIFGNR